MNQAALEAYVEVLEARCRELESKVGRLQEGVRNLLGAFPLSGDAAPIRVDDTTAEGGGQPNQLTKTRVRANLPSNTPAREDPAQTKKARRGLDSHEAPLHSARLQRGSSSRDQAPLHEGGHERSLGAHNRGVSVRQARHGGRRNRTGIPTEGGWEDQGQHGIGVPQAQGRADPTTRRDHPRAKEIRHHIAPSPEKGAT